MSRFPGSRYICLIGELFATVNLRTEIDLSASVQREVTTVAPHRGELLGAPCTPMPMPAKKTAMMFLPVQGKFSFRKFLRKV